MQWNTIHPLSFGNPFHWDCSESKRKPLPLSKLKPKEKLLGVWLWEPPSPVLWSYSWPCAQEWLLPCRSKRVGRSTGHCMWCQEFETGLATCKASAANPSTPLRPPMQKIWRTKMQCWTVTGGEKTPELGPPSPCPTNSLRGAPLEKLAWPLCHQVPSADESVMKAESILLCSSRMSRSASTRLKSLWRNSVTLM